MLTPTLQASGCDSDLDVERLTARLAPALYVLTFGTWLID